MKKISKIFVALLVTACAPGNQSKDETQATQKNTYSADGKVENLNPKLAKLNPEFASCKQLFKDWWREQMIGYSKQIWKEEKLKVQKKAAGANGLTGGSLENDTATDECDLDASQQKLRLAILKNLKTGELNTSVDPIFWSDGLKKNPLPLTEFRSPEAAAEFKKFKKEKCFASVLEKQLGEKFAQKNKLRNNCNEQYQANAIIYTVYDDDEIATSDGNGKGR